MRYVLLVLLSALVLSAGDGSARKAADFSLKNMNNRTERLSEAVAEQPLTLVNFWATWCVPCAAEMKEFNTLYQTYHEKGLRIISVSVDDPKTAGRVRSWAHSHKVQHDVWMDTNNDVMRRYSINALPFTMIIDRDMNIIYEHNGYRKGDMQFVEEEIRQQLGLIEKGGE